MHINKQIILKDGNYMHFIVFRGEILLPITTLMHHKKKKRMDRCVIEYSYGKLDKI